MSLILFVSQSYTAQENETDTLTLRLSWSVADLPQQTSMPYRYPTMQQAFEWSNNLNETAFFGIGYAGDRIFGTDPNARFGRKAGKFAFNYGCSLLFSRFGNTLPIPLGEWAHEEFHRAVLGAADIRSKNGNWIFNRWDGTVYGVSDSSLYHLKATNPDQLLYAYTAGVQSEVMTNRYITINDSYDQRSYYKNAFLLYNAWYSYNYFRFAASPATDSVKILAPPHEDVNPENRDFAGSDLTTWVYDLFSPDSSYFNRDPFPNGSGVNRRTGFSDLTPEGQDFLRKQKQLSLLNFLNPAIFFVNRIRINEKLSFLAFAEYVPTHFGNSISVFAPVRYKQFHTVFAYHQYASEHLKGCGITLGIQNYPLSERIRISAQLTGWNQPVSYFSDDLKVGGAVQLRTDFHLNKTFHAFAALYTKSTGWDMGNPYLRSSTSLRFGLQCNVHERKKR